MKLFKNLLSIIALTAVLAACSSSKQARTIKSNVDGNWQLQTVETEGIAGTVKVQVFNEADMSCFVGSMWKFNSNNSLGSYNLSKNAGDCFAIKRDFRWSIFEQADMPSQLQFKRLDAKLKEIDGNDAGYRLRVIQATETNMQLKLDITFENRPAAILFNYVRM